MAKNRDQTRKQNQGCCANGCLRKNPTEQNTRKNMAIEGEWGYRGGMVIVPCCKNQTYIFKILEDEQKGSERLNPNTNVWKREILEQRYRNLRNIITSSVVSR
jgi:hypothetical protein